MVGENNQVLASGGYGGDEERLEVGLAGQAPEPLGLGSARVDEVLGSQAQPLEDGVIREIQDTL